VIIKEIIIIILDQTIKSSGKDVSPEEVWARHKRKKRIRALYSVDTRNRSRMASWRCVMAHCMMKAQASSLPTNENLPFWLISKAIYPTNSRYLLYSFVFNEYDIRVQIYVSIQILTPSIVQVRMTKPVIVEENPGKLVTLIKWGNSIDFQKIVVDFYLNFERVVTHAFDRADQTTERGISRNWIFQVLRDFFLESILPVKACEMINISRNNLPIAKSFGCL